MSEARRLRLFFALWPDDALRRALARATRAAVRGAGGRPVPAGNLHITLAFLGNVAEPRLAALESLAEGIAAEPFELLLGRLGFFARPRSLWLGPAAHCPALMALAHDLSQALGEDGWLVEQRPYTPHLTLARKARDVSGRHQVTAVPWQVKDFSLIHSVTDQGGAVYRELNRWPLQAKRD